MRCIERAAGALLLLAGMAVAGPAPAALIFSDDFNRKESDTVGNDWIETERNSKDVAIVDLSGTNRRLMLRDEKRYSPTDAAAAMAGLTTVGYTDIVLSYEWAPRTDSESEDVLHVQWRSGPAGTWQDVATHELGGNGASTAENIALGALAAGVADFELRFWTDVSSSDEGAYIDNVALSGTSPSLRIASLGSPPLSVPEPGTLALLGLGLAGIAALRRGRSPKRASPSA